MPARFSFISSPAFRRDLEGLPARVHDEVLEAVKLLEVSPKGPHPKIKKLKGKDRGLPVLPPSGSARRCGVRPHTSRLRPIEDEADDSRPG